MEKIVCSEEDVIQTRQFHSNLWQIISMIEKRQVFYMYPQAKNVIQTILVPRFLRADITANDRGLIYFLYGDYHTGKSYLLKYFSVLMERSFPEFWVKFEQPIIHYDLNNHINTASQLLVFLLDKLGRPVDPRVVSQWHKEGLAKERLQGRLISALERLGTRILILDECQKLLIARNTDLCDIFELLKDLCTRKNWSRDLRTQIVLCGTKDGLPLLEAAQWIQGRTRTIRLLELGAPDFGALLISLYRDYISIGISKDWDLMEMASEENRLTINSEMAAYLFARTQGKIGLAVDLIRNAVLLALDEGRLCPQKEDYEAIRLDQKAYVMKSKQDSVSSRPKMPKPRIHISLTDRLCQAEKCLRSKTPYQNYRSLIDHYKKKHPEIELVYEEEK